MVSVNAYGVLDNVTFPLLFQVFKPEQCLKTDDVHQSKPDIAVSLLRQLHQQGFHIDIVLADRLYGESNNFIQEMIKLQLPFVVAIRDNHKVWTKRGTRQRHTRWQTSEFRMLWK